MTEKQKIALLNEFTEWRTSWTDTKKYFLNEWYTSMKMEDMINDDTLVDEQTKPIVKKIYHEVGRRYFCEKGGIRYYTSPEAISKAFLERLEMTDPDGILLGILSEKHCGPLYRQFDLDHQKWVSLAEYTAIHDRLMCNKNSLAELATKVITKSCNIKLFPINKLQSALEAKGFELDEEIVNNIVKKNELNNYFTAVEKSNDDLCEINDSTSSRLLAGSSRTASQSFIDLYKNKAVKTNCEIATNATDDYRSKPKKARYDTFHHASSTPLSYNQTMQQLSGNQNYNPFSNLVPATSFADTADTINNLQPVNQSEQEVNETDNYNIAFS